jgi:hypothetical protein
VGLGLSNGPLKQLAITDRPSRPAVLLPLGRQSNSRPAQLLGGAGDGGISPAGSTMEQPEDRPAAAAGEELSRHTLVRPGQMTTATGCDHKGARRA